LLTPMGFSAISGAPEEGDEAVCVCAKGNVIERERERWRRRARVRERARERQTWGGVKGGGEGKRERKERMR